MMPISRRDCLAAGGLLGGLALSNQGMAQTRPGKGHVVLLGDSIFDNKTYVGEKPAVIDQVRTALGKDWEATLLAVDGDVTEDVVGQLKKLPATTSHLVISAGGNDALMNQGLLLAKDPIAAATFLKLSNVQKKFESTYKSMIDLALDRRYPIAVCTIYDPNFVDAQRNQVSATALSVFNDRITRIAFTHGIPVIDLRLLFSQREDYANPIEPGPQGGAKIAEQIKQILLHHDFSRRQSMIYPAAQ